MRMSTWYGLPSGSVAAPDSAPIAPPSKPMTAASKRSTAAPPFETFAMTDAARSPVSQNSSALECVTWPWA